MLPNTFAELAFAELAPSEAAYVIFSVSLFEIGRMNEDQLEDPPVGDTPMPPISHEAPVTNVRKVMRAKYTGAVTVPEGGSLRVCNGVFVFPNSTALVMVDEPPSAFPSQKEVLSACPYLTDLELTRVWLTLPLERLLPLPKSGEVLDVPTDIPSDDPTFICQHPLIMVRLLTGSDQAICAIMNPPENGDYAALVGNVKEWDTVRWVDKIDYQ